MAAQSLLERIIAFEKADSQYDEQGIKADLVARGAITGSQLGVMLTSYQSFYTNDLAQHSAFCCSFFVTSAQDPNYTSQIAALQATWSTYNVYTWSKAVSWGV